MEVPKWLWPTIITASAAAIGGLVYGGLTSPIRPILAFWFLAVCPGMALVRLLRLRDAWTEVALATAISLSLDVIVALSLVYSHYWSPKFGLAVLIGVSLLGAALQLLRRPALATETDVAT